jgi:hypothetical protein
MVCEKLLVYLLWVFGGMRKDVAGCGLEDVGMIFTFFDELDYCKFYFIFGFHSIK